MNITELRNLISALYNKQIDLKSQKPSRLKYDEGDDPYYDPAIVQGLIDSYITNNDDAQELTNLIFETRSSYSSFEIVIKKLNNYLADLQKTVAVSAQPAIPNPEPTPITGISQAQSAEINPNTQVIPNYFANTSEHAARTEIKTYIGFLAAYTKYQDEITEILRTTRENDIEWNYNLSRHLNTRAETDKDLERSLMKFFGTKPLGNTRETTRRIRAVNQNTFHGKRPDDSIFASPITEAQKTSDDKNKALKQRLENTNDISTIINALDAFTISGETVIEFLTDEFNEISTARSIGQRTSKLTEDQILEAIKAINTMNEYETVKDVAIKLCIEGHYLPLRYELITALKEGYTLDQLNESISKKYSEINQSRGFVRSDSESHRVSAVTLMPKSSEQQINKEHLQSLLSHIKQLDKMELTNTKGLLGIYIEDFMKDKEFDEATRLFVCEVFKKANEICDDYTMTYELNKYASNFDKTTNEFVANLFNCGKILLITNLYNVVKFESMLEEAIRGLNLLPKTHKTTQNLRSEALDQLINTQTGHKEIIQTLDMYSVTEGPADVFVSLAKMPSEFSTAKLNKRLSNITVEQRLIAIKAAQDIRIKYYTASQELSVKQLALELCIKGAYLPLRDELSKALQQDYTIQRFLNRLLTLQLELTTLPAHEEKPNYNHIANIYTMIETLAGKRLGDFWNTINSHMINKGFGHATYTYVRSAYIRSTNECQELQSVSADFILKFRSELVKNQPQATTRVFALTDASALENYMNDLKIFSFSYMLELVEGRKLAVSQEVKEYIIDQANKQNEALNELAEIIVLSGMNDMDSIREISSDFKPARPFIDSCKNIGQIYSLLGISRDVDGNLSRQAPNKERTSPARSR